MIYIAINAFLFLLRFSLKGNFKLRRQLYPILLFILFLFSAFRYEVGCDWTGYQAQYQLADVISLDDALQGREALWWMLLSSMNGVGLDYPWLNVISSAIAFGGIHVLARRQPDPFGFLILLFPVLLINMPMSAIRQGAAIGLMCIAITRLVDKKAYAYAFWVLLAASFHSSAIIFILLTPLIGEKITKLRVLVALLFAVPGAFMLIAGDSGKIAVDRYVDSGTDAFGALFRLGLLALSGMFYFVFLRRAWKTDYQYDYSLVTKGALGMIGIIFILPVSSVIGDRLGYYLIPIQTMIFARVPWLSGLAYRGLLMSIPYIGLLAFFIVWSISSWHFQKCYLPYQNWLF